MMEQSVVKHEDASIHQGEAAMRNLGPNGLIDAMIMWHIKRDNFDMPMLIAMQVSFWVARVGVVGVEPC